ncbi:hypothetical protein L7F22_021664 [Adiantum nelumboides]|nr:hypothetical protein [Adiantum nelumboides]
MRVVGMHPEMLNVDFIKPCTTLTSAGSSVVVAAIEKGKREVLRDEEGKRSHVDGHTRDAKGGIVFGLGSSNGSGYGLAEYCKWETVSASSIFDVYEVLHMDEAEASMYELKAGLFEARNGVGQPSSTLGDDDIHDEEGNWGFDDLVVEVDKETQVLIERAMVRIQVRRELSLFQGHLMDVREVQKREATFFAEEKQVESVIEDEVTATDTGEQVCLKASAGKKEGDIWKDLELMACKEVLMEMLWQTSFQLVLWAGSSGVVAAIEKGKRKVLLHGEGKCSHVDGYARDAKGEIVFGLGSSNNDSRTGLAEDCKWETVSASSIFDVYEVLHMDEAEASMYELKADLFEARNGVGQPSSTLGDDDIHDEEGNWGFDDLVVEVDKETQVLIERAMVRIQVRRELSLFQGHLMDVREVQKRKATFFAEEKQVESVIEDEVTATDTGEQVCLKASAGKKEGDIWKDLELMACKEVLMEMLWQTSFQLVVWAGSSGVVAAIEKGKRKVLLHGEGKCSHVDGYARDAKGEIVFGLGSSNNDSRTGLAEGLKSRHGHVRDCLEARRWWLVAGSKVEEVDKGHIQIKVVGGCEILNLSVNDAHDALNWGGQGSIPHVDNEGSPTLDGAKPPTRGRGRPRKSRKKGRPKGSSMHTSTNPSLEFTRNIGRPRKQRPKSHAGGRPGTSASPYEEVSDDDDDNDEHASEGEGVECGDDDALEVDGPCLKILLRLIVNFLTLSLLNGGVGTKWSKSLLGHFGLFLLSMV